MLRHLQWAGVVALILATSARAAPLMPAAELQSRVEAFAGRPARVDPRLLLPECAAPELSWLPNGQSVMVWCPDPDWRVYVPVEAAKPKPPIDGSMVTIGAAAISVPPAIRRGDRVVVESGGQGFMVAMEAIAEGDARDGRVALRSIGGGRRLNGIIAADGSVGINALSAMVNRR